MLPSIVQTSNLLSAVNLSAGTTSGNLTAVTFSNANGVSFGLNAGTVTASHNALTSQSNQAFSADASSTFQTLSLQNSNGISFSNNAGAIRLTHDLQYTSATSAITSNALHSSASRVINIVAATNSTGGGTASLSSNVSFSAANGLTFYTSAGNAVVGSYTVPTVTDYFSKTNTTFNGANVSGSLTLNTAGLQVSLSVAAVGGAQTAISGIVVSDTTYTSGTVSFSNAGNITVSSSVNGATQYIRLSGNAAQTTQSAIKAFGVSNTGQTAGNTGVSTGIDWVLAGSQSITLSQSTAGGGPNTVWFQHPAWLTTAMQSNAATLSNIRVSAGTTSNLLSAVTFADSNGISFGLNASTITATYTVPTQTNQTGGIYITAQSTGQSSSSTYDLRTLSMVGDGIVSAGWSNGTMRISATQSNQAFSAAGGSSAFQTLGFSDNSNLSFTNTNGSVGVASVRASLYAVSNTTQSSSGTQNLNALSFGGAGIASVGVTNGSVVISVPSGGGAGDGGNTIAAGTRTATTSGVLLFSDSNNFTWGLNAVNGSVMTASYSQTNQAMSLYALGNTTQNSSTTLSSLSFNAIGAASWGYSNGSIQVSIPQTSSLVGASGLSVSTNGSTISVYQQAISSYENIGGMPAGSAMTWNGASVSHAVAFNLPGPISASFLRIPVLMTTNSTTLATMASATASASGGLYSTINAVIYSLGTGGSSRSLQSVASGSAGFTMTLQVSVTNSTQASYSQGVTMEVEGQAGRTNLTTQYSVSNTNYSFTTNQIATNFSSARYLDIPFANSLTPGPYWLIIGMSSTTSTAGAAGLTALTNCNVRYSNHFGLSQHNFQPGVMGSTNLTSGGVYGAGSFSTAGGGTTNSLPISAISTLASNVRAYFQLLRSA